MAPDAESCDEVERLQIGTYVPVHQGRRILPEDLPPAQAWTENEELLAQSSPGENRRLLGTSATPKTKSKLQAGLTLGVCDVAKKHTKHKHVPHAGKPPFTTGKTTVQKRKQQVFELLRPPYFILSMIILIIVVHMLKGDAVSSSLEWSPGAWRREAWRLLSYGLVHFDIPHLALNALVALTVGWVLEREQGWWRVALVWAGGVAAGALGAGALQPRVHVVGASAAVYALLTAHLPNVCLRYGHIPLWWFRPLSVVVLAASETCWMLMRDAGEGGSAAGGVGGAHARAHVAWSAHALGAAVGVPLGFLIFTGENVKKLHIVISRSVSGVVLAAGTCSALAFFALSSRDCR